MYRFLKHTYKKLQGKISKLDKKPKRESVSNVIVLSDSNSDINMMSFKDAQLLLSDDYIINFIDYKELGSSKNNFVGCDLVIGYSMWEGEIDRYIRSINTDGILKAIILKDKKKYK